MTATKRKRVCEHIIAEYWHSTSEICSAHHCSDIDGLGTLVGFFNYCSTCGERITAKMRKDFWKEQLPPQGKGKRG